MFPLTNWELRTTILLLFISCAKVVESAEGITALAEVKYVRVNTSLWLNCSLETKVVSPRLNVSWYYNYQPIHSSDNTVVTRKGQLTLELNISAVALKSSGLYLCGYKVSADSFIALKNYTVIIGDIPQPFRQQRCYKFGYPPKVYILWNHHRAPYRAYNLTYTVFYCKVNSTARNYCSKSNLKLYKQYSSTESCKDFTVGAHTSRNLFNKYCNITTIAEKLFPDIYSSSVDIKQTVLFSRIQAKNIFGAYTSNRIYCKLLQNIECSHPSNLRVTPTAKQQLLVQWDPPDDFPYTSNVLYYTILYSARGDKQNGSANVPFIKVQEILAYTLIKLLPYTQYQVYISCGISGFDDIDHPAGPVTVWTLEQEPSFAPKMGPWNEIERDGSKRSVKISWELPSKEFWNGRPERIVVEYWKVTSVDYLNETEIRNTTVYNGSAKSAVITGLDLDANYSIVVRLCTGAGCSVRSSPLIIPAQKIVQKDNTNGRDYILPIAVGLGVGLPVLLALITIGIGIYRYNSRNSGTEPLDRIMDEVRPSRERYEDVTGQRPLVEEHSDYEDECQEVLTDKRSPHHASRGSLVIDQNTAGTAAQNTRDKEERYVLLEKRSNTN